MTGSPDEFTSLRISTASHARRKDIEAFREAFGRSILKIDMHPLPGEPLQANMMLRAFPGFGIASGTLSPMRNRHRPDLIDNDDLVLVNLLNGHATLDQHGRRTEIRAGQVVLTANGETATFTGHTKTTVVNLRLSRAWLAPHLANLGDALLASEVADSAALRLLKAYARTLADEPAPTTPPLSHAMATHLHDLAALAIGATRDSIELAKGRGLRAGRLRAIKSDILAHVGDARLSIAAIASRQGISTRYARRLLERDGTTFAEYVLGLRLSLAQRLLLSVHNHSRAISAIAFECGFSDLSYFNRTFRRRYGATPSEIRERGARD